LSGQESSQRFDRFYKAGSMIRHKDLYRVKVFLAQKASAEICARIHCRLALMTARTHKPKYSFHFFARNPKNIFNDKSYRY